MIPATSLAPAALTLEEFKRELAEFTIDTSERERSLCKCTERFKCSWCHRWGSGRPYF